MKFTQRLKKYPDKYKGRVRTGILVKLLDKDKGDIVHWYATYTEVHVKNNQCWKKKKSYSIKPENLNLDEYKNLLLIPASIISCNYEDVLTGRVHVFDFTNLC